LPGAHLSGQVVSGACQTLPDTLGGTRVAAQESGYCNQQAHDEDKPHGGSERRHEGLNEAFGRRRGDRSRRNGAEENVQPDGKSEGQ
jgi:hypothetical protein